MFLFTISMFSVLRCQEDDKRAITQLNNKIKSSSAYQFSINVKRGFSIAPSTLSSASSARLKNIFYQKSYFVLEANLKRLGAWTALFYAKSLFLIRRIKSKYLRKIISMSSKSCIIFSTLSFLLIHLIVVISSRRLASQKTKVNGWYIHWFVRGEFTSKWIRLEHWKMFCESDKVRNYPELTHDI